MPLLKCLKNGAIPPFTEPRGKLIIRNEWRSMGTKSALTLLVSGALSMMAAQITPVQQAYLKAAVTHAGDNFGYNVAAFGDTIVVGAPIESSSTTGVNGDPSNTASAGSGAAYVFVRN